MASCFHGRLPWVRLAGYDFDGPQEVWELYNVAADFSQSVDLAEAMPEKLVELQQVFDEQARLYGVYPMRDPGSPRNGDFAVPHVLDGVSSMTYTTAHVRMPESSVINIKNCSFAITAQIEVPADGAVGVIACQGGVMAGWSLYLNDKGAPVFHYNWYGHEHAVITGPSPLDPGEHVVQLVFAYDGGFGAGGQASLLVDGTRSAEGRVEKTVPLVFSMSGETFDVGTDTGSPVGDYSQDFSCTASIRAVTIERLNLPSEEVLALVRDGMFQAGLRAQ